MGNGLQNPDLSFEELYEQGRQSVPMVQNLGNKILNDLKGQYPGLFDDAEFQNGPLKTLDRAQAKIQGDYKGHHEEISDLARGRIIIDKPEQIEALRQYFSEHKEDLGIEKYKDRFAEPSDTGFRDINTKMRLPNGHVIEFRIEHRDMLEAAKATHDPYEEIQKIERRANSENRMLTEEETFERQKILDRIRDIHNAPAQETDLDRLLNNNGRDKMAKHEAERVTPHTSPQSLKSLFSQSADVPHGIMGNIAGIAGDLAHKAGPFAGAVLGVGAAGATYFATGDAQAAVNVGYETVVPYGEAQIDLIKGDVAGAEKSATEETISIGGAWAGAVSGGVIAGPIGAVVGGVAGGIAANPLLEPVKPETIPMSEAHKRLSGLDESLLEMMSPETQSLYALKDHPEHFSQQYKELSQGGGIDEVSMDLGRIITPDTSAVYSGNLNSQPKRKKDIQMAIGQ
jgi:hypothetical protein